jgi:fructosamine-3-kinase
MPVAPIHHIVQLRLQSLLPDIKALHYQPISGGSINDAFKLNDGRYQFFCKINSATKFPHLFAREVRGLQYLQQHSGIRVPKVILCFEEEEQQVLVLEWINEGERKEAFWENFGKSLAAMHKCCAPEFGFNEDNYMGSVPQSNRPAGNWVTFFKEQRLEPLVKKCTEKSLLSSSQHQLFCRLYQHLPDIFPLEINPSLQHGDLWSGNFMCDDKGQPVLIDPAIYFGHPSVDLGMTTLFGGFNPIFYKAYQYHAPFPPNYREQWEVANLYPLLVHLYLFGNSYLHQIIQTLKKFQ